MKIDFFIPQTAKFDKSINLFCLVFLRLEFSFIVIFLQLTHNRFPKFLYITHVLLHHILLIHYLLKQIRHD